MIRKLAIALSLLGACSTGFVHALGLGEVTVKSALNQPLNAEIELVNTADLTINEILPGLATREEFLRADVDRVYFLSDLRFEVITSAQGKAIIVLTSKKPVREPFLNFIVELIWPSGRLLREYALLIDPPLFSEQPVAKVSTPKSTNDTAGDILNVSTGSATSSSRPLLVPVQKIETNTYGATNANDTLWDIAIKARPNRDVSPQQIMLAIQDLNSDAFIDNNINKLKAGHVLRLPSVEQIKQRNQHQAIIGVIAQNEAFAGKRTPSIVQGSNSKEELATPSSEQKMAVAEPGISNDELKLVVSESNTTIAANSANSGQSNQGGSGSANDLAITLEKLDKSSIENKELTSRVGDLEEQLSTLQRLLTLKNDQLASIQSQMRANELAKLGLEDDATSSEILANAEQVQVSANENDAVNANNDANTVEQGEANTYLPEENVSGLNESNENLDGQGNSEVQVENAVVADQVAETSPEKLSPEKSITPEPASQNLIQTIINNPVYLSISIIIVLVLVFILWMISRYNAKREEEFQSQNSYDSDIDGSDFNEDSASDGLYDEDSSDEFDAHTSSDLDDGFDSSDDAFAEETEDESQDVLAEVNAYISYGRLDQAAEVLEKAISQDPVRTDYRLKLLSIYKDLGDRQAFDRQFSELEAIQDTEALSAAEKIRDDLLEEESLQFDTDSSDLSFDSGAQDDIEDVVVSDEADDEVEDEDLKAFNFDSVSIDEAEDLDLATELDLDSLDLDSEDESSKGDDLLAHATDDTLEEKDVLELESLDADLDLSDEQELEGDDFDDSILDVDLEDLDLSAELEQETEIALEHDSELLKESISSVSSEEELVVSDDILEEATQAFEEDIAASDLDEGLSDADEFDFLNGTDEASTKLDLARAYIDMGDLDGAKDILLEVTKEGSEAQQAEASDLLNSID